jgi:hypothetical protein
VPPLARCHENRGNGAAGMLIDAGCLTAVGAVIDLAKREITAP